MSAVAVQGSALRVIARMRVCAGYGLVLLALPGVFGCKGIEPIRELGVRGPVESLTTSGTALVATFLDNRMFVWDWRNLDYAPVAFQRGRALGAAMLAPDRVITEWADLRTGRREVIARDLRDGRVAQRWPIGENWYCSEFCSSPNGQHVAVLLEEQRPVSDHVCVGLADPVAPQIAWVVAKGRLAKLADTTTALSNDGRYLALLGLGRMHVLAVVDLGERRMLWQRRVSLARAMTFSPDGRILYVAGHYGVHALDPASGQVVPGWKASGARAFPAAVTRLAASPDGRTVAVGTEAPDGRVYVLDARTGARIDDWRPAKKSIIDALAYSPDARLLATADQQTQSILMWKVPVRRR